MSANPKELTTFDFQGNLLKVFEHTSGKPCFVGKEVCMALDIANHKDAIGRLKPHQKSVVGISDPHGRVQDTLVVFEGGLYRLAFRSNKTEAEEFTDLVCDVILPTIRKTGSYSMNGDINFQGYEEIMHLGLKDNPELLRQAIQFYEDLKLSCNEKRVFLKGLEKEMFPNNYYTRGKRKTLDVNLYLRQVADRYQFGIKIVGQEIVTQRSFWGSDRAI